MFTDLAPSEMDLLLLEKAIQNAQAFSGYFQQGAA